MRIKIITIVFVFILSAGLMAQGLDGIYQIGVEDRYGRMISSGTGFYVNHKDLKKTVILTSFHLLNSVLLNANNIKIINGELKGTELSIVAYDELNDVLVLGAARDVGTALTFSRSCEGPLVVAGYHKGSFLAVDVEETLNTKLTYAKKLPVFLTKGFSGAPVLNRDAEVCGMVVLSSEQNASSIAVINTVLQNAITDTSNEHYKVADIRGFMGLEYSVGTQNELDRLIGLKQDSAQIIVKLKPKGEAKDFILRNSSDVILEPDHSVNRILVHNSKNVMLRGLNINRLMINESSNVSVNNSVFEKTDKPILIKDSKSIIISDCLFRNVNTGVVFRSSEIDEAQLIKDNEFNATQHISSSI